MTTQPQPPQQPVLILDDPDWTYTPNGHQPASRRLRVYRTGPGRITAILTERGPGTSITNAASVIRHKLAYEYPDDIVTQIEHYPVDGSCHVEHFDTYDPDRGHPWRRLPLEETADLYGIQLGRTGRRS